MLSLHDRVPRNEDSTQDDVHSSADEEAVHIAKACKMPRANSNVQRRVNLRSVSVKAHDDSHTPHINLLL